ncbi:MAG: hypothetical protein HYV95_10450 [Opitutae bacterium]|nr:hypothetical protein [Opitutae bacterium]
MKSRLQLILLLVTFVSGLLPCAVASERWETLRAINWVENPTNHTHYGSKGELGPYQFRRDTWRMHTRKPFTLATDRATADEVAVIHYEWLKRQLADAGVEPTAFNIAMAWNCGVNAVISGRAPTVSYRYAEQVTNLVESFQSRGRAERLARVATPAEQVSGAKVEFAVQPAPLRFVLTPGATTFVVASEKPRYVLTEQAPLLTLESQPQRLAVTLE